MKKVLIYLKIVQIVSNDERDLQGLKRLGEGYSKAHRLNPFNPLAYIFMIATIPFVISFFVLKELIDLKEIINVFKWK